MDPGNTSLDLTKDNATIYRKIVYDSGVRVKRRVKDPAAQFVAKIPIRLGKRNLRKEFTECLSLATISAALANGDIAVGDLVVLTDAIPNLWMVAQLPAELGNVLYTFVNHEGEIVHLPKAAISIRVPVGMSETLATVVDHMVVREIKFLDIAPIGVPDGAFLRTKTSCPKEFRQLDWAADDKGSEDLDASYGSNLIVNQASSQTLVNSDVNTYFVPTSARQLYSRTLARLTIEVYEQLPEIQKKLRELYKRLQRTDLLDSPRTVSIFQILKWLETPEGTDDRKRTEVVQGADEKIKTLEADDPVSSSFTESSFGATTFCATALALRMDGRHWIVSQKASAKVPTTVDILPLAWAKRNERIVEVLKCHRSKVADDYVRRVLGQPVLGLHLEEFLLILKDYVVDNFRDAEFETAIVSVIREIDLRMPSARAFELAYHYSKARAFEILQSVQRSSWHNPARWAASLQLPQTGVSLAADLDQEYYEGTHRDDFYDGDPFANHREDYRAPVFCIDSPFAHEIDDGVSIIEREDYYTVSVHIAHPSSYVRPGSVTDKIARGRAITTYLPEGPSMMYPPVVSEQAGLGKHGEVRTMAFEYDVDKGLLDGYMAQKRHDPSFVPPTRRGRQLLDTIALTARVKMYRAANFPSGFTYERVNEVFKEPRHPHFKDLNALYHVALLIHNARVRVGHAVDVESASLTVKVDFEKMRPEALEETPNSLSLQLNDPTLYGKHPVITISTNAAQSQASRSQMLVSQLMISANYAASELARKKDIPVIYRLQEINLHPTVRRQIEEMTRIKHIAGEPLTTEEQLHVVSCFTGASLQPERRPHSSIGLDGYATVTSPLRRYVDVVNHRQFEKYLMNKPYEDELASTATHIQSRELISKKYERFSRRFWEGMFLEEYVKMHGGVVELQMLVMSLPKFGDVRVVVERFPLLTVKMERTERLVEQFRRGELRVGQTLRMKFEVVKLDYLEDEVIIRECNRPIQESDSRKPSWP